MRVGGSLSRNGEGGYRKGRIALIGFDSSSARISTKGPEISRAVVLFDLL